MIEKDILKTDIRERMFLEMSDKDIFIQAKNYAFEYVDKALGRNVYPTEEAIADLEIFNEDLPYTSNQPADILKQLHKYGSPSTVSQIGGRYFGFVNGGVVPTALAAKMLSDFWDQNAGLYVMSPIVSKLESVVET